MRDQDELGNQAVRESIPRICTGNIFYSFLLSFDSSPSDQSPMVLGTKVSNFFRPWLIPLGQTEA
jgi:hypothetical protein